MKTINLRIWGGVLLIGAGLLFLLQTLGFITGAWDWLWMAAFAIGGGFCLYLYRSDRSQWWALIPALAFFGLAGAILLGKLLPNLPDLGGMLFLGGLSAAFWLIYLTRRDFWWAIIPGGVLLTLVLTEFVDDQLAKGARDGLFFVGLALTFLLVALLARPRESFWWAYIPAGVLFVLGVLAYGPIQTIFNLIWPVALILAGGWLIFRNLRNR